jgi:aryl-alcohol dehydrogenase-like predicted oxidoreductase
VSSAPRLALGCNNLGHFLDLERSREVVHAALDVGITWFVTSDIYGEGRSEDFLGQLLRPRWDEVTVATKFGVRFIDDGSGFPAWEFDASPESVRESAEASLRRLGVDTIDLYQMHGFDRDTPLEATLEAMDELVRDGKVREIGCSNATVDDLEAADRQPLGEARFVAVENEYSLVHREPEYGVLDECRRCGLAFLAFSPLANGLLTGKYRPGESPDDSTRLGRIPSQAARRLTEQNFRLVAGLEELAGAAGRSLLELALAWLAAQPGVTILAGATSPEQVRANVRALEWRLGEGELAEIERLCAAATASSW